MKDKLIKSHIGNHKISFRKGDPLVVFLNGAGDFDTEQTFRPIINQIPNSAGILAIDYLNSSLSGLAKNNFIIDDEINIFINLIQNFKASKIIIVAHSIGGIFALRLANKLKNMIGFIGIEPTTKEVAMNPNLNEEYKNAMKRYTDKNEKEVEQMVKGWLKDSFDAPLAHLIWQTCINASKRKSKYHLSDIKEAIINNDKYHFNHFIPSIIYTEPFRTKEYQHSEYKTNQMIIHQLGNNHYLYWKFPNEIANSIISLIHKN